MNDVKWVKLSTDMFDHRKIKCLRNLPSGNDIVLIWVMLLTLAGKCNANGMIFLTENIAYTPQMLANELGFGETTIQLAIAEMEKLGMISTNENSFIRINGWEEYQNTDALDKIREQNRLRQQRYRERQSLPESTEETVETVEEAEEAQVKPKQEPQKYVCKKKDVSLVIETWNGLGLQKIQQITSTTNRGKMLKARISEYGIEAVIQAIKNIGDNPFLRGQNNRGWIITFDWFVKPNNFPKVLEGNYNERTDRNGNGNNSSGTDRPFSRLAQEEW